MTPDPSASVLRLPPTVCAMADSLTREIKELSVKDPLSLPVSEFESSSILSEKLEQNEFVFSPEYFQVLKTFLDRLQNVVKTQNDLDSSKSRAT
ncbi:hypothetical protein A2U01_0059209, partial [Trifolium medium]|nr:hypothetical protein [Trifolium medium]